MVTLHSNMLLSSTNPAEKPSTGFLLRSKEIKKKKKKACSESDQTHQSITKKEYLVEGKKGDL